MIPVSGNVHGGAVNGDYLFNGSVSITLVPTCQIPGDGYLMMSVKFEHHAITFSEFVIVEKPSKWIVFVCVGTSLVQDQVDTFFNNLTQ